MNKFWTRFLALAVLGVCSHSTRALDASYSIFGTAGYAVSDQDYKYQRFIASDGTFKRDSVLGAQLDTQFSPEWSATLQAKLAPSQRNDRSWAVNASWAFVSWRPDNDWLVRAGKVRIPLYLFSENLDVGQSYDFARMPTEMYSIAPTTDIAGLYVTRSWSLDAGDLSLDVYSGRSPVWVRFYGRDAGANVDKVDTHVTGLVTTLRGSNVLLRAGVHHAITALNGIQTPQSLYAPSPFFPTYYVPQQFASNIANDIVTVGVDWALPQDWRFISEVERDFQHRTPFGANTVGGYISLLKSLDRWTPYVALSAIKTVGAPAKDWRMLTQAVAPPGYDSVERMLADAIPYYDQHSLAVGTSFSLNAHSKVKAEWLHTWIGNASVMVDSPSGGPPVSHQGVNVLSFSYNFAY